MERRCHLQECGPRWFTSPWGQVGEGRGPGVSSPQCSASCGEEGDRLREVVCLRGARPSPGCRTGDRPQREENCRGEACREEGGGGEGGSE